MSLSIGELARMCGLNPSAIRYYEQVGLMPKPERISRQRRYTKAAIGRLRLVQVARQAGFTVSETRMFVAGFSSGTPPAERWRTLAKRKLEEIDRQMARLESMRSVLHSSFRCKCPSIDDCARIVGRMQQPR